MNAIMFALLVLIVSGICVALFAAQNSQSVTINFAPYHLKNVSLYVVVLCALFFGILISWIISLWGSILTTLKLYRKNSKIKNAEKDKTELVKRVHKLELENERLKESDAVDDKSL